VGLQSFINIGVNMGLLPTKGLTLPFMSYGRSSMLVALAWAGMVLRTYHEAVLAAKGSAAITLRGSASRIEDHAAGDLDLATARKGLA